MGADALIPIATDKTASLATKSADERLIESVTYLASLASQPLAVDAVLDNLRMVTARAQPGQPLSTEDRRKLLTTIEALSRYLITQDPLRTFTKEVLNERLRNHFQDTQVSHDSHRTSSGLLPIATVAIIISMIPLAFVGLPFAARAQLSIPLFLLTVHICIIWFYLSALKGFTPGLQRAYRLICGGIFVIGIGAAQFPIINAFALERIPLFRYGGIQTFFTLACCFLYAGVRVFAGLVNIRNKLKPLIVVALAAALAAIVAVLPHASYVPHEAIFDLMMSSQAVCAVLLFSSARLVFLIRSSITSKYSSALGFFCAALLALGIGVTEYATVTYFLGETYGLLANLAFAPFIIAELLLLRSGVAFKRAVEGY